MTITETPVRRVYTVKDHAYFNHTVNEEKLRRNSGDFLLLWNDKGSAVCELALPVTLPLYTAFLLWLLPLVHFTIPGIVFAIAFAIIVAGITFTAPEVILVGLYGWQNRRITQRTSAAYIVEGVIVRCTPSDGRWIRSNLVVQTTYIFFTPTGEQRVGSVKEIRDDLNGRQLPAPQTPVYVLYFSDQEFYLL